MDFEGLIKGWGGKSVDAKQESRRFKMIVCFQIAFGYIKP